MHFLGPLTNRNDRFPYPFFNSLNPNLSPSGRKPLRPEFECLRGSLPKSGPLDFATKNTFPLFFVDEEALVGIY